MDFKPSAGEISNIWRFIIGNQAHLCFLEHWIFHVEDEELKVLLQQSREEANRIVNQGLALYLKAGFPSPIGFSLTSDVNPEAPRLLSDKLIFFVLHVLSEYGVYAYGLTLGKIETLEVLSFFQTCLINSANLYKSITEGIYKKGYQHQSVFIPVPKQAEMVEKQSFLAGWFGEQRPVSAIEIDSLIFSLRGAILEKMMYMMFAQIAVDPKVQKYCQQGMKQIGKLVKKIQSLNSTENLPFQATYETELTDSPISPFSDKLILFEALSLAEIAMARYGNTLSFVTRRDLSSIFALYVVESGTYADDGLSLMIEKKWFEQPPMAFKRNR